MVERYKINEDDIEKVMNYLRIFHPDNANRDFAIEMLEYLKAGYHRLASVDVDALEDLYEAFQKSKHRY